MLILIFLKIKNYKDETELLEMCGTPFGIDGTGWNSLIVTI